jgi:hypothetical protein
MMAYFIEVDIARELTELASWSGKRSPILIDFGLSRLLRQSRLPNNHDRTLLGEMRDAVR